MSGLDFSFNNISAFYFFTEFVNEVLNYFVSYNDKLSFVFVVFNVSSLRFYFYKIFYCFVLWSE